MNTLSNKVDDLIRSMTLQEKTSLTSGLNFWATRPVERLGIPSVWMTDGPNGVRGPGAHGAPDLDETSTCAPCGTALGATWDPDLVERIGRMIGAEARRKGYRILLAPTVNLHRSPLGGRNFESYSEDPVLAGVLATSFVRGAQSTGVAVTVKHFAGNESEFERMTMNSVISDRALRELYLLPFEMAVRDGGALGVMTAYNRLNGRYCAEHRPLIAEVLRGEWGFDGLVVTDWGGAAGTAAASRATLDLEMPGPGHFYGANLADAVASGEVNETDVDASVQRILSVFERIGALDDDPAGFPETPSEGLAREAAAAASCLLKNEGPLLPLEAGSLRTLAIIGPNAANPAVTGGGSAQVDGSGVTSLVTAIGERLGDFVEVVHEPGLDIARWGPLLREQQLLAPDGRRGLLVEIFPGHSFEAPPLDTSLHSSTELAFQGTASVRLPTEYSARARASYTPRGSGPHTFTMAQLGRARLIVDGTVVLDGIADPPPAGPAFMGLGSGEIAATVELAEGRPAQLEIEYTNLGTRAIGGVRVGCHVPVPPGRFERAVAAAANSDAAIVVVGTSPEWESEGFDRDSLHLPCGQDRLVAEVIAANPRTVVVVNSGSVIAMPWAEQAAAVLQVWFGGEQMASAVCDVLFGDVEPGGRLPVTIPWRLEHTPSYGNFPAENGRINYGEGVLIGYRWYESRRLPTQFPFGHGLSYSEFVIGEPELSTAAFDSSSSDEVLTVDVPVTNTGSRRGIEVVQCYIAARKSRLGRPPKELKAFAKIELDSGEAGTVRLTLRGRAFSYWDDTTTRIVDGPVPGWLPKPDPVPAPGWVVDEGVYELHIGRSSADIAHVVSVDVGVKGSALGDPDG